MKSLLFTNLLSLSLLLFNFSVVAQAKPSKPICDYPVEAASQTTKQYVYPKFGFMVELPDNLVSMGRVDGSVEILDKGTYRTFQCPLKQRLGRGYYSYIITWGKDSKYKRIEEIKKDVYLIINSTKVDTMYFYDMSLRIIGGKNQVVDLIISDDTTIDNSNFDEMLNEYMELGKGVTIIGESDR